MKASRRREGELVALAFNQKEQRLLEKSVVTIRHQASYSLKLLEVNNRNLKVYFRHLRDKVSRLKSHLSVDQIQQLRTLEDEGKLHPTHPSVNLGSALKIAATHRRLHPSHLRPPSTPGGHRTPLYPTPTPATNGQPPPQRLKRSNSVTGVFIDVPQSAYSDHRPQSASVTLNGRTAQLNPAVSSKRATNGGAVVSGSPVNITSSLGKGEENGREKSVQSRDSTVTPDQREPLQTSTVHAQQHNPSEHNQPRPTTASSAHSVTCQSGGPPSRMSSAHNVTNQSRGLSRGSSAHNVTSQSGGLSRGSSAHNVTSQSGGLSRGSSAHNVTSQSGGLSRGSSAHNVTSQSGGISRGSSAHNVTSQSGGLSRGSSAHNVTSQSGGPSRSSSAFVRTPFSSHTAREKAVVEGEGGGRRQSSDLIVGLSPRSRYSSMDKESTFLALLQDDSMDDLDQELFQERREELIEEEQLRQVSLTKRKDRFLKDLDNYLHDHPPPSIIPRRHGSARKVTPVRKNEAEGEEELPEAMFRRRRVDFDLNPTCLPETDYRQRLQGLWKDMNKCRYLRMSDDLLDLSGVNTLATDNLKLYTVLKKQDRRLSVAAKPPTREI
ncbi:hypothetical protein ACOMHN_064166 [Nucella lapillus]